MKTYRALLGQVGTNDPVVAVLENNLGSPGAWEYADTGLYRLILPGAFPQNKTFILIGSGVADDGGSTSWNIAATRKDDDTIVVATFDNNVPCDTVLSDTSIEIRVYP